MRVSDSTMVGSLMFHLQRARARQAETQIEIASGKRLALPSDDPVGFGKVVDYKTLLAATVQRERTLNLVAGRLDETDSALQAASSSVMGRAKELAVAMTNATNSPSERTVAAAEITGLIGQLLDIANRTMDGQALFTGSTTRGRVSGLSLVVPTTITASVNDTLAIVVDGVSSGAVTLAAGSYSTGAALAAQVESAINADATLAAAGKAVTVSFASDHLVMASHSFGALSSVTVTSGSARNVLGLHGGTTATGSAPFSLGVSASADPLNTGSAVIAPGVVTDRNALTGDDYLLTFTDSSSYAISSVSTGTVRASGPFTSGAPIVFDGIQLSLDATGAGAGAPAANDRFHILATHQYHGDATDAVVEVGDGLTAPTLVNGQSVFGDTNDGTDAFGVLQTLARALRSNNVDGIASAHRDLDVAANQITTALGTVGARANRLVGAQDGLASFHLDVRTLLSRVEDIDIAKAVSDLALQQLTLQAAAQSTSSLLQTSLLNYLR